MYKETDAVTAFMQYKMGGKGYILYDNGEVWPFKDPFKQFDNARFIVDFPEEKKEPEKAVVVPEAETPTVDAIDRKAAIGALADYIHNVDKVMGAGHLTEDDCKDAAASVFEELPSAQPEPCEDAVSRQAAIDAAAFGITYAKELRKVIDRINALPSAEPQRKKGKWIVEGEFIDCSVCRMGKWSRIPYEDLVKRFRFCPNCGADMRGDNDG